MRELLRCALVATIACSVVGNALHDHGGGNSTAPEDSGTTWPTTKPTSMPTVVHGSSTFGNGTCVSRTANYITHTLPQQCLRTDRINANASHSTGSDQMNSTSEAGSGTDTTGTINPLIEPLSSLVEAAITGSSTESHIETTSSSSPSPKSASGHPTVSAASDSTILSADGTETDSPLDNANFLSFEEWKKQAMAKYADQGGNLKERTERQRPGINNALEGFGEDGEIELDFSGFGSATDGPSRQPSIGESGKDSLAIQNPPTSQTARSRDAGKTCKERTNYASFDCAANVLKNNPECKSASSVLVENKDSYMLNTCSAQNKFFIVELCDVILVDTVVLANYEFFSSIFRHFRVSVSDKYPVKMEKWVDLGTFEARNTREMQAFLIEHSKIWARYLRIEFLTHYGSEYYCPISLLRVHGTTMLEEIRAGADISAGDSVEEATKEAESTASSVIDQGASTAIDELSKEKVDDKSEISMKTGADLTNSVTPSASESLSTNSTTSNVESSLEMSSSNLLEPSSVHEDVIETTISAEDAEQHLDANENSDATTKLDEAAISSSRSPPDPATMSTEIDASMDSGVNITARSNTSTAAANDTNLTEAMEDFQGPEKSRTARTSKLNSTESSKSTETQPSPSADGSPASSVGASTSSDNESTSTSRLTPSSSVAPAQPQPSTQESFFKSVHKRLQQLEANSTLSLQYIEEQSRILRDAFSKVEKRQITATSSFLTNLNDTVMNELRGFRQAYDQLWQSTVIELEGQREQYQREMLALSSRLTLVADELVWQKRMGIVQSTLLLLCLGLVLFARGNNTAYLEVPLMQQVMNKSSAALARGGWETPPASPSPENRSPVGLFRRKLWRSVTEPSVDNIIDGVTDGTDSRPESKDGPQVNVEPPSPPSSTEVVAEWEYADDEDEILKTRESQSGPATPTGTREKETISEGILDAG